MHGFLFKLAMKPDKDYIHYLSFLKCIAMLAVIGIHVFGTPTTYWPLLHTRGELFFAKFMYSAFRAWAVPVFTMVSGALFLNPGKALPLAKLYKKYILRLVGVLMTFGLAFSIMEIVFSTKHFEVGTIWQALLTIYSGKTWAHLWYLYIVIGLYLVTPPLRTMVRELSPTGIRYLLLLLFVFSGFFPFLNGLTSVPFGIRLPGGTFWVFFYVLGYAFHAQIIVMNRYLAIACIASGLLWCAFGQFLPDMPTITGSKLYEIGTETLVSMAMSAGVFSLAKQCCKQSVDFCDTLLNPLSFGIYVIHALFVNLMFKVLGVTPEQYDMWVVWTVVFIVTSICSFSFAFVFRKIPFIGKKLL